MTEKRKEQMRQANRRYRLRKKMEKLLRIKQEEKEHDERMNKPIKKHDYVNGEKSIESRESEEINTICGWCGALKGLDSSRLCEFCSQFDSKEEMLAEKEWLKRERLMRLFPDNIPFIGEHWRKYHSDWKCRSCGHDNLYYKKACVKCGLKRN